MSLAYSAAADERVAAIGLVVKVREEFEACEPARRDGAYAACDRLHKLLSARDIAAPERYTGGLTLPPHLDNPLANPAGLSRDEWTGGDVEDHFPVPPQAAALLHRPAGLWVRLTVGDVNLDNVVRITVSEESGSGFIYYSQGGSDAITALDVAVVRTALYG